MKTAFFKLFDTLTEGIVALLLIISTTGLGGLWLLLTSFQVYIAENIAEYLFIAFFSMVGQTAMWFIKFRFPSLFGKHELEFGKNSNGTLFLHWFIDCLLAGLAGALFTKYMLSFIFLTLAFMQGAEATTTEIDFHKIIVGSVLVGMFYEVLVKKGLKKKKELEKE